MLPRMTDSLDFIEGMPKAELHLHIEGTLEPELKFEMLIDVCGVDYQPYGTDEWQTTSATGTKRAVGRAAGACGMRSRRRRTTYQPAASVPRTVSHLFARSSSPPIRLVPYADRPARYYYGPGKSSRWGGMT